MNYTKEIEFIDKMIAKSERSLSNAEKKPNAAESEILDIKNKLTILNNIKNKLES